MKIKLKKDKVVEVSMTKQLEEAIKHFGSTCAYAVKNPRVPHLWEVNDNAERLDAEKQIFFTQ